MQSPEPKFLTKIAVAGQEILAQNPVPDRVALPYLHFRNAHPSSLRLYSDILEGNSGWKTGARALLKGAGLVGRSAIRREPLFFGDALPDRADVLFISHFVSPNQAATAQDNYFGNLPAGAAAAGHKSVLAHVNHTWCQWRDILSIWAIGETVPRIILSRTIGAGSELKFAARLIRAAEKVAREARQSSDPFKSEFARHTRVNALDMAGFFGLRTAVQVGTLVKKLRPKYLVTTFEGNLWERLAFQAAKQENPAIKCIGYHHTVLFPHEKALANKIGHGFDPDVILTAGEVSADWFGAQDAWKKTPMVSIGSVRRAENTAAEPSEGIECLVAPEGIFEEARHLFATVVEAAPKVPDQIFRLRLHPVLPKPEFLKMAPEFRELPPNVKWSETGLDTALKDARYVIYRGSTVVITAVLAGVRPIYLSAGAGEISLDPLAALEEWRMNAQTGDDIASNILKDRGEPSKQRGRHFTAARSYCGRYFMPLSDRAFLEALTGLAGST